MIITQSVATKRPFYLGVTALTPAVALSKNGASFAAAAGVVSEIGVGWYLLSLTVVDTNTLGPLAWSITGAGVPPLLGEPVDQVFPVPTVYGVAC